jgi:signal transduction histidine kinase/ligand-binding sensor domain-containing protein
MHRLARISTPIWFILWLNARAQYRAPVTEKRCPIKTINYEQGLTDNLITGVITDAEGFSWISTSGGIQRYNGYILQPVTPVVGRDTIPIDYPVFFTRGKNNTFLIGYKKGILQYSSETNSFTSILERTAPDGGQLHSLMPLKATTEGIWCFDETKGIVLYPFDGAVLNRIPSIINAKVANLIRTDEYSITRKLIVCNDNYIFMRERPHKILEINTRTHESIRLTYPDSLITGLGCNEDKLYVSTATGVTVREIRSGLITNRVLFRWIGGDSIVTRSSIELSSDDHLLVSSEARLFEFDTAGNCQREIIALNRDPLLKTGYIQIVYEDPFRRIWLLTNGDIKRIENAETPFSYLIYPNKNDHFIRCLYYDNEEKTLFAARFTGFVELYDSSGRPLWPAPVFDRRVGSPINIEKAWSHHYLIVTLLKGWFLLNSETRRIRPLRLNGFPEIRNNWYFNSLQRIDDSTLLFSTKSNVFSCRVRRDNIRVLPGLLPDTVSKAYTLTTFLLTKDSTLWVATTSGLILRVDRNGVIHRISVPDNYVRAIVEDGGHRIWVGSETGLYIYDREGRLIRRLTRKSGLLSDVIYALQPADSSRSNFFASTNFGLSFISAAGTVNNYPRELGLQDNEFNTQSFARSADGRLFFGGINGVTAFYPAELSIPRDSAQISIVRFAVNDSAYNSFGGSWRGDTIRLPYDRDHLQFDLAATGLLNPNEYLYKYRLQGFDRTWQNTTQPTGIRYILEPGSYWLDITCSPVLYSTASLHKLILIVISPPWWQMWWIITSAVVMSILIIFGITWSINRQRYRLKMRRLEIDRQLVDQRERISRELHDNIGTQLSYISNSIDWILETPGSIGREEEKVRLSVVNETARNLVVDLRETIWAMKKEFIMLDEFADKLKLYLQAQAVLQPNLETEITEDIGKRYQFSPNEALNIFRICQEAVANAVRHSQAGKIWMNIHSGAGKDFSFIIEDNGKGFIRQDHYHGHYGLENMTQRASEAGVTLMIESQPGKGTKVSVFK